MRNSPKSLLDSFVKFMDYGLLAKCADAVIEEIILLVKDEGSTEALQSIKQQMLFIRDSALEGKTPSIELGADKKFTYAILASRELASPKELLVKKSINKVSRILDDG